MKGAPADRTQHADQKLSEHAVQRRHEVVRLDAHVQKAANYVDDVVRVDRGEHEVAGQRGLNGNLRRFFVTNFADHDLVRIVAQNRAQPAREGQTLLFVHWNLGDAVQLIFDRVFNGDDLVFFVSDFVERGVERSRLAGAGGPGHQHHAVRLGNIAAKLAQIFLIKTDHIQIEILEGFVNLLLVENTNYGVFAVHGRHDRDTKIDVPRFVTNPKAAVLRHASFGDIQFRHDLDTRDQRLVIREIDRIK